MSSAGQLTIAMERQDRGIIVRLSGEGHLDSAVELGAFLDTLAAEQPAVVVADLSGLAFISSLVMGCLVKFRGQLRKSGGSLRMAALQPDVAGVFKRARLDWAIPTFDTLDEAFAQIR